MRLRRAIQHWRPALVLITQPLILFRTTLVSKTTHIPWDLTGFHVPLASFVVDAIRHGHFPLWDPYSYAFIDSANVGFLVREGPPLETGRLSETRWQRVAIASERPLTVYRNLAVLPRYRMIGDVRPAANLREAREQLGTVDPRRTAIVGTSIAFPLPIPEAFTKVAVLSYAADRVELQVEASHPAFLLAAEGYAPGWRATLDGIPHAVYPANVAFMGLPVAAGRHIVILQYSPQSLAWWGLLSAISWTGLGIWTLILPRLRIRDSGRLRS